MRLLDMLAYAAAAVLGGTEAFIGHRHGGTWRVVACSRGAGAGVCLEGRVLTGVHLLPTSTLVPVALEVSTGGPVHLGLANTAGSAAPADLVAYVGPSANQHGVLVAVERPATGTRAEQQARLAEVHTAVVDAVAEAVERESRLRTGLAEREEERRRWARELHDETLQQLGALQVLLSTVRRRSESDVAGGATEGSSAKGNRPRNLDPELVEMIDTASALVNGQITGLRQLITELRPATLDDLGLRAPLQALAERTEQLSGLPVSMRVSLRYADGDIATRLVPDVELAIYRVVQEALTNASRHSGASRAEVSVIEARGSVQIEVRDDGHGVTDTRSVGFGVPGMRERAQLAGGTLEVLTGDQTPAGRGTVIRMIVPAQHRDPPGADDAGVADRP